jgi:Asp-tRNA(Asn)/Glu-tRNA(Gln) amidotransferase A subunit family amidase
VNKTELCFTPAVKLARMIREREISPMELTQAVLERIEAVNPQINAYCTPVPEFALRAAQEAEKKVMKKEKLGTLHGIPLSIKDLTPTKGIRTTWGSRYYKDFVPQEDALVVQRLKAAGAIILGKTNTPEFGIGINTTNPLFGTTLNPWDDPGLQVVRAGALPRPWLRASALSPRGAIWEDPCVSPRASAV